MVVTEEGTLCASHTAYDRRVAGVISGAANTGQGSSWTCPRRCQAPPIALVGKVYCKVDAGQQAVDVGDLLTTSGMRGHAMKATDPARAFGAVIGKSLGVLASGVGLVPILVAQ